MNILTVCIHYPVASGRYIKEAFKALGHDSRSMGPMTGTAIWGIDVDERYIWKPDYLIDGQSSANMVDWKPDLIVTAESAFALKFPDGIPHVCYACDNHVRDYNFFDLQFDAIFACHSWGARMGEAKTFWTPPSYEPRYCRNLGYKRDISVGMVAVPYDGRTELIDKMRGAGMDVLFIWGPVYEEYERLYNRIKIALIKSAHGDISHRVFEVMAMGCCVLMDEARDMPKLGFIEGEHYIQYNDAIDAAAKAKDLLESGRWQAIAKAGQAAAVNETWQNRARFVLDKVTELGLVNSN